MPYMPSDARDHVSSLLLSTRPVPGRPPCPDCRSTQTRGPLPIAQIAQSHRPGDPGESLFPVEGDGKGKDRDGSAWKRVSRSRDPLSSLPAILLILMFGFVGNVMKRCFTSCSTGTGRNVWKITTSPSVMCRRYEFVSFIGCRAGPSSSVLTAPIYHRKGPSQEPNR